MQAEDTDSSFRSPYLETIEEASDFLTLCVPPYLTHLTHTPLGGVASGTPLGGVASGALDRGGGEIKEVYDRLKSKLELLKNEGVCTFTREEAEKACLPILDLWSDFGALSRDPPPDLLQKAFSQGKIDVIEWCEEYEKKKGKIGKIFEDIVPGNLYLDNLELLDMLDENSTDTSNSLGMFATRGLKRCFDTVISRDRLTYMPLEFSDENMWKGVCENSDPHRSRIMEYILEGRVVMTSALIGFLLEYLLGIPDLTREKALSAVRSVTKKRCELKYQDILNLLCARCASKGHLPLLKMLSDRCLDMNPASLLALAALGKRRDVCEYLSATFYDKDTYIRIAILAGFPDIVDPRNMSDENICLAMVNFPDVATAAITATSRPLLEVLKSIPHRANRCLPENVPDVPDQNYTMRKIFDYVLERDPSILTRPRYPDLGSLYKSMFWSVWYGARVINYYLAEEFHISLVAELSRKTSPEFMHFALSYVRSLGLTKIESAIRETFNRKR